MTVEQVIKMLKKAPKDAKVFIFDPDLEEWAPVTGMTYSSDSHDPVKLYSDDP